MILKDKVIVITGGSEGFGRAIAQALKDENANVIISSHNLENLKKTANDLSVDYFSTDTTSYEEVKNLGRYVVEKFGKLDFWVNNAGIQIAPSLIESVDIEKMHRLFEINFFGYVYGIKVALFYMKKQNNGVILNVNSTAGLEGKPEISAYSSSKFAIKGLTESIRKEVKDFNINILQIFPGGMQTNIYREKIPSDIKDYMNVDFVTEKVIANLKADNPDLDLVIRRPGK